MFELIKTLSEKHGVSGREHEVAETICRVAKKCTGDVHTDALGNVIAHKKGAVQPKRPIVLAAHMD